MERSILWSFEVVTVIVDLPSAPKRARQFFYLLCLYFEKIKECSSHFVAFEIRYGRYD